MQADYSTLAHSPPTSWAASSRWRSKSPVPAMQKQTQRLNKLFGTILLVFSQRRSKLRFCDSASWQPLACASDVGNQHSRICNLGPPILDLVGNLPVPEKNYEEPCSTKVVQGNTLFFKVSEPCYPPWIPLGVPWDHMLENQNPKESHLCIPGPRNGAHLGVTGPQTHT